MTNKSHTADAIELPVDITLPVHATVDAYIVDDNGHLIADMANNDFAKACAKIMNDRNAKINWPDNAQLPLQACPDVLEDAKGNVIGDMGSIATAQAVKNAINERVTLDTAMKDIDDTALARDIKVEIIWVRHLPNFDKELMTHYTTLGRLMTGEDKFSYGDVEVIAKRQFIDVFDSHNQELYEGDIVEVHREGLAPSNHVIAWRGASFDLLPWLNMSTNSFQQYSDGAQNVRITKIGNIHQHPELKPW